MATSTWSSEYSASLSGEICSLAARSPLVPSTRTRTAISSFPRAPREAETVAAEAPPSEMLTIMASVISGITYPPWLNGICAPVTVTTLPRFTPSMSSGSLELSR